MTIPLGRWELHEPIGRGGMGVVHRAIDSAGRVAAVKVLDSAFAQSESLARFAREARALERLDHPGIVRILDSDLTPPHLEHRPWIAMELIEGPTLDHACNAPSEDWRVPTEMLARIADAIAHAHQQGIVHRDLKPSNVILRPNGWPCVLDFGIARLIEADEPLATMATRTGMLVGTIRWMSPEQVMGMPDAVGPATDVHALGLLAHELLVGEAPWIGVSTSLPDAIVAIANDRPRRLRDRRPELPRDLDDLVAVMLSKSPARRPSMGLVANELRRISAGRPTRRTRVAQARRWLLLSGLLGLIGFTSARPLAMHIDDRLLEGENYAADRALLLSGRANDILAEQGSDRSRNQLFAECDRLARRMRTQPETPLRRGARALLTRSQWRLATLPVSKGAAFDYFALRADYAWQSLQAIPSDAIRIRPNDRRWNRAFAEFTTSRAWEEYALTLTCGHRLEIQPHVYQSVHWAARSALERWSIERGRSGESLDSLWVQAGSDSIERSELWLIYLESGVHLADDGLGGNLDTLAVLAARLSAHATIRSDAARRARVQYQRARIARLKALPRPPDAPTIALLDSALAAARAVDRTQLARDIVVERSRVMVLRARTPADRDRARSEALVDLEAAESWPAEWPVDTDLPALIGERARIQNDLGESSGDTAWFARARASADRGLESTLPTWLQPVIPLELERARAVLGLYERSGDPALLGPCESSIQRVGLSFGGKEWPSMLRMQRTLSARLDRARLRHGAPIL